jgi:hypothetical protein
MQQRTRGVQRISQPLHLHIIIGLSCYRLHASTACKAHPVGYRDIPRGLSSFIWRRPLLQPTTPEQPAPEQPTPEQPAPEQPAPEQPTPEQPAPEQPVPVQPAPIQHAAEWLSRVQVPPHLQRCADGATTFSETQHLLSGDVTPPRGPEVSLSGSRPSPADQWHSLRSCV